MTSVSARLRSVSSVTTDMWVRLTTTGATFAPTVELVSGSTAVVSWETEEGGTIIDGLSPTIDFGTAATRHVRLRVMKSRLSAFGDVTTLNLGFNNGDDNGIYTMGTDYNKTAQAVSLIENVNNLTGLVRFAAANGNLAGPLDFTGCSSLQFIECYFASVTSVNLTGCTSLIRLCMEHCNLASLDLNPVAVNLKDLRAAVQRGGTLTFVALTAPLASLYHFCVRDQLVMNHPTAEQLPVVQERWDWNTGQTGALTAASSALRSVMTYGNSYTTADFTNQFTRPGSLLWAQNNLLTSVILTGCTGLADIDLHGNNLSQTAVDSILATVLSWGQGGQNLDLHQNTVPSAQGVSDAQALTALGWTVSVDVVAAGVLSDDFERADATGIAAVGNGWEGTSTTNIVSGDLIRVENGGYQMVTNPAQGTLPADYTVTAHFPAATIGAFIGIIGRWDGSHGVRVLTNNSSTTLRVGDAAGYLQGEVTVPTPNFPASWTNQTAGDHTLALRMMGTTVDVICDGQVVTTCTIDINTTTIGTGYGICGEGRGRAWSSIACSDLSYV